jgi:glycosyltransferase involved in cell wall biosynthesis
MAQELGYRIAFFTNTYHPFVGGVARSVDLYRTYLKQAGHDVVVYAPEYDEETDDADDVRRLPAIRQFNQTDFSLPLPVSFKPVVDLYREAFDVIHVHHPFLLGEMGMRMARTYRLPLVFTYHTQYEQYTHNVPFDQDTSARTIIKHSKEFCDLCDLVIAPTSDVRAMLEERGVTSRIAVLPTGIEKAQYDKGDREEGRKLLGLESNASVLLHVGRLSKEKNLPYLLEASLHTLTRCPDARLVIVGDGDAREELEATVEKAGDVGGQVHFTGKLTGMDLINAYAAADLFVFASKSETQGMVLAEAMAAGNPVVALEGNGIRDVLRDNENGRMLPGNTSAEDYGQAVADLLHDKNKLEAWRKAALETAAQMDMPILTEKLLEEYRTLKLMPNQALQQETMSFGLIRSYFETVWSDISDALARI